MQLTREEVQRIARESERILKERFGVKAVYMFGSARGDTPWHEGSDLDLAVEALEPKRYFKALVALDEVVPVGLEVDLITLEDAPPELAAYAKGERKMPEEPLEALKQQIGDELRQMERVLANAQGVVSRMPEATDQDLVVAAGKYLDSLYNGMERIFERICVWLEGQVPSGADWHRQLWRHMQAKVEDIRPSLLDEILAEQIEEYLRFRHRFRHSYGPELIWEKMEPLIEEAPSVLEKLKEAISQFLAALAK